MPKIKSAKKDLRKSARKHIHNLSYLNKIRNYVREIKKLALAKKGEEAKAAISKLYKVLDKAVKENVVKKNTAARKKSRLTKLINKINL